MTWILKIVGVVLSSVLADVLLPSGQMNKFVKGIFAILLIFTLLDPVLSFAKGEGLTLDFSSSSSQISADDDYLFKVTEKRAETLEELLSAVLKRQGVDAEEIVVCLNDGKIASVQVVLNAEYDFATIKDIICGYISVDQKNIVIMYGS